MAFTRLTRKHGLKIVPGFPCSVEEVSLAVAKLVGASSVKSAARMNGGVVIFLDEVEKANAVITSGVVFRDTLVLVTPLAMPAKKVMLSNIPPFIPDELIIRELSRYGKVVSPVKKLSSGCKAPELKHVVSHRRQLYMLMNSGRLELNLSWKLTVDGFEYVLFATTENMKCFGCGQEGHLVRSCPGEGVSAEVHAAGKGERRKAWGQAGESESDKGQIDADSQQTGAGGGREDEEGLKQITEEEKRAEDGVSSKQAEVEEVSGHSDSAGLGEGAEDVAELEHGAVQTTQCAEPWGDSMGTSEERGLAGDQLLPAAETGGEGETGRAGGEDGAGDGLTGDVDMGEEDDTLRVTRQKRKSRNKMTGSQAKKAVSEQIEQGKVEQGAEQVSSQQGAGQVSSQQGAESDLSSGEESEGGDSDDFSDVPDKSAYKVTEMSQFLKKTKNMKGVNVNKYFPDKKRFVEAAKSNMKKKGKGGLTTQEIYRLKKFVQRVSQEINIDDGEDTS